MQAPSTNPQEALSPQDRINKLIAEELAAVQRPTIDPKNLLLAEELALRRTFNSSFVRIVYPESGKN